MGRGGGGGGRGGGGGGVSTVSQATGNFSGVLNETDVDIIEREGALVQDSGRRFFILRDSTGATFALDADSRATLASRTAQRVTNPSAQITVLRTASQNRTAQRTAFRDSILRQITSQPDAQIRQQIFNTFRRVMLERGINPNDIRRAAQRQGTPIQ